MADLLASIHYNAWVLPVLLALPTLGAFVLWAHRLSAGGGDAASMFARRFTLLVLVAEFIVSVGLWWSYDPSSAGWQAVGDWPWIDSWGVRFTIGIDGISLMMVLLTTLLMPLAILGGWTGVKLKVHAYHACMLLLTTGMLGVFVAKDLFLFYVMWEVMLVPMYFIIGIWGGERRIYASLKFFIYTMVGSLLMLVAIVILGIQAGAASGVPNFSYEAILALPQFTPTAAYWLFGAFFLAFAVKVPMFPFHTWLPDAHVEAPTAGSVVLAGILLKLGTYGFLRVALPFFPGVAMHPVVRTAIITLAVIGIIYGSLVALVQPDIKKLVAYSSVAHLGFVMLGIFALTVESVQGALMVMIGHGLSTGALFLLVGIIYERTHTRMIDAYGGIAKVVPLFATILTVVSLSSIGLPGTNGFVAEFLVMVGSYKTYPVATVVSALGVILAAAYLLWALQRLIYNPLDKPQNKTLRDLNWRELGLLAPLLAGILWLGVYPQPVLRRMEASATALVRDVSLRAERQQSGLGMGGGAGEGAEMNFDLSRPGDLTLALTPDLILCVGAMGLMLYAAWGRESVARQQRVGLGAMLVALVTLVAVVVVGASGWTAAGGGAIAVDGFRWSADIVFLLAAILVIGLSLEYNAREGILPGEAHVLVLFATFGMMLMAAARDLMVLFLGIETMSIAVYVLAGLNRRSARSAESAIKYFLLGAFSTAFLLYGIALVYGATGSTNLTVIGQRIAEYVLGGSAMLLVGMALLLVGFAFKLAAAPFHMWAPDVYEGAPTPITAYMAAAVKAAAFAAFLRVWIEAFGDLYVAWHDAVWILAAATMLVGNLIALQQRNLKRMLAYSSIGHTGFILVAVTGGTPQAATAFLFYLLAYTMATMGAFAIIVSLGTADSPRESVDDYHGLWHERPGMAMAMAVFMLALLGFPVFGGIGFFAKWYVLQAAIAVPAPQAHLAVLLVLTTTISAGYYLNVVMVMFMKPRPEHAPPLPVTGALARAIIFGSVLFILLFGVYPDPIVRWTRDSGGLSRATAPAVISGAATR